MGHYDYVESELGLTWGIGDHRRLLGYEGKCFVSLGFFGVRVNALRRSGRGSDEEDTDWFVDALLEVPGELCAQLGAHRLLRLCSEMDGYGFDATRLDVAYDVTDPNVNVKLIEDMFKRKQVVTRSERRNAITGAAVEGEACSLLHGGTLRIGGRQSEMFMKVYDKRQEHLQRTGIDIGHCTRFELEIKGQKAKSAFRAICDGSVDQDTGEILGPLDLASFMKDFITFYKTPKQKQVCEWWEQIDSAPMMVWPKYEQRASLDATLNWMRTQVMPTWKALEQFGMADTLRELLRTVKPSREMTRYMKALEAECGLPI